MKTNKKTWLKNLINPFHTTKDVYGTKYSRMDEVKFGEDSL